MVSRLEWVLIAAILFFASREGIRRVTERAPKATSHYKQLMLERATFREVNQTAIRNIISAARMTQYSDELRFDGFRLHTSHLVLLSDKALQHGDIITLDHHSTIYRNDGTQFYATDALYNKKTATLILPNHFAIHSSHGDINGSSMQYDQQKQSLKGTAVKARYEME